MGSYTLGQHADDQLSSLGSALDMEAVAGRVRAVLPDLLGAATHWPLDRPKWPSIVADDHSPIEYSVAFAPDGTPTIRLVTECMAANPSAEANQDAALSAIAALSTKIPMSLDRFAAVSGPFLAASPAPPFSLCFALVAKHDAPLSLKAYLNPAARGRSHAQRLVEGALDKLGFTGGMRTIRTGQRDLSTVDQLTTFALDLDDTADSRAKVYVSHFGASAADVRRAAGITSHGDAQQAAEFCVAAAATDGPLARRPLISAYTFLPSDEGVPSGYSLYVPIRDYVADDAEALARASALANRHDLSTVALRSAVDAVRHRDLAIGRGLIAHLSLRTGPPRPGMTVYLSAEAYEVTAARATVGAA